MAALFTIGFLPCTWVAVTTVMDVCEIKRKMREIHAMLKDRNNP